MQRFYIGGIPNATSQEDLRALFAKVCHVEEVHLPQPFAFGLQRSFAIIRLSGIDQKAEIALKRLDGVNWKGSRLKIDKAKEWYRDRLETERANEHNAAVRPQQAVSKARLQPILPFAAEVVKLRRRKGVPALKAATKPLLTFHDKTYGGSSTIQGSVCRRIVFDDSEAENMITKYNLVSIDVTSPPSSSTQPSIKSEQAKTTATSATAVKAVAKGGGERKGFGTLLYSKLPFEPPQQLPPLPPTTRNKSTVKNDDMYEHADFEEGPGKEMSEEELLEDRQRMLRLALMLAGDSKPQLPPPPVKEKDEKKAPKKKSIDEVIVIDEKIVEKQKHDEQPPPDGEVTEVHSSLPMVPPIPVAVPLPVVDAAMEVVVDNTEEQFSSGFAQMNSLKSIFAKQVRSFILLPFMPIILFSCVARRHLVE